MVSTQFIPPSLSVNRVAGKGADLGCPIGGSLTLLGMRTRTPFGERLFQARTHAKLTQTQLCEAAGVSQGNLGELEWKGDGSMAVVRLAMACGVRPEWLAEGDGDMLDPAAWPFTYVTREQIEALEPTEIGIIEGAMLSALERIQGTTNDPAKRLRQSSIGMKKPAKKRHAA